MTRFLISDGAWADIRYGERLKAQPEFILEGMIVAVGPYSDRNLHERHVLETVGSVDWFSAEHIDEVRFDSRTRAISSVALHVPEREVQSEALRSETVSEPGLIYLVEQQNFRLKAAESRWLSQGHAALICMYDEANYDSEHEERVRISDGLDIVINSGALTGWILHSPHKYLTEPGVSFGPAKADRELEAALESYLTIVSHPAVDELLDGDAARWSQLDEIKESIPSSAGDSQRRSVLRRNINALIEEWRID